MESDSESDIAAVDDGEEDTERVRGGAGKEDEAGDHLDPKKVREQLLDYLDELSSAESSTDEEEGDVRRRKYHHLPWRSRCWRGDFISIPKRASRRSAEDTLRYRHNYPVSDIHEPRYSFIHENADFYHNRKRAYPCGELIDDIHSKWWGKYRKLETQTNYIEWLFPTREVGTNWHSQELQKREIKSIVGDWEAHNRVFLSYEMMLDFYGIKMKNHASGALQRAPGWRERFQSLNQSNSSHRHITRMLKCLGELNHEKHKPQFVEFILHEAITEGTLPNTLDSCMEYWVDIIRSSSERKRLRKKARQLARVHNRKVLETRAAVASQPST